MGVVALPLDSHDGTDFHWSADLRKQETENGEMLVASVMFFFFFRMVVRIDLLPGNDSKHETSPKKRTGGVAYG